MAATMPCRAGAHLTRGPSTAGNRRRTTAGRQPVRASMRPWPAGHVPWQQIMEHSIWEHPMGGDQPERRAALEVLLHSVPPPAALLQASCPAHLG